MWSVCVAASPQCLGLRHGDVQGSGGQGSAARAMGGLRGREMLGGSACGGGGREVDPVMRGPTCGGGGREVDPVMRGSACGGGGREMGGKDTAALQGSSADAGLQVVGVRGEGA